MSRVANLGFLLVEQVIGSFFFTSSSNFWLTIYNCVLYLDLRLICRVTHSLTKGFFRAGIGLTRFPKWGMTIYVHIFILIFINIFIYIPQVRRKENFYTFKSSDLLLLSPLIYIYIYIYMYVYIYLYLYLTTQEKAQQYYRSIKQR